MRLVTADLYARTIVGIEPGTGLLNCSMGGSIVGARRAVPLPVCHIIPWIWLGMTTNSSSNNSTYSRIWAVRNHSSRFVHTGGDFSATCRGLCTLAVIFPPRVAGNDTEVVEAHFAVDHLAEEGKALVGDHGDEVTALGGVVIAFEADGAAVVGGGLIYRHEIICVMAC